MLLQVDSTQEDINPMFQVNHKNLNCLVVLESRCNSTIYMLTMITSMQPKFTQICKLKKLL